MKISFESIADTVKRGWIIWFVSSVVTFLLSYFLIFPSEFGAGKKKWVQEFYCPSWPEVSLVVFQRGMQELSNRAPEGFQSYRYDYDWRKHRFIRLTTVWKRGESHKVITDFYALAYTNAMTALVDGLNFQEEFHRLSVMRDYDHLNNSLHLLKKRLDFYNRKREEFEAFQLESLTSNLLVIASNHKKAIKNKERLMDKRLREIRKWYPKLSKLKWDIYKLMADELLERPLKPKPSVWVFATDLREELYVNIQPWQRIMILVFFALIFGFVTAYFWIYAQGEVSADD